MALILEPKEGDTLLSPDELNLIIPSYITNRIQLDEVEQANIEDAMQWIYLSGSIKPKTLFTREFQNSLHKRMLGNTWKWAGQTRKKETNIGVLPYEIEIRRKQLNDNALYWVENKTFLALELAVRFHHELVKIHCYPNGNGRHSRIMADLILMKIYNLPEINWIGDGLINESESRKAYIEAMKLADKGDFTLLLNCII